MLARKPRNADDGARFTVRPSTTRVVLPTSRTWTLAVHEAGHCVMAYLLDLGINPRCHPAGEQHRQRVVATRRETLRAFPR